MATGNATLSPKRTGKETQTFIKSEKEMSDTETKCSIYASQREVRNSKMTGLCVFSPKYLVVADSENSYVSLYDVDGEKFVAAVSMAPLRPFDVAKIGGDKVVVTIPTADYSQIFLIQDDKLVDHGKIRVGGGCFCVAYNNLENEIALLSFGKMKIFSFKTNTATWRFSRSKMMKTVAPGGFGGQQTEQMPESLGLSPKKDVMYISSKYHNKIKAKLYRGEMNLIRSQAPDGMRKPEGLTVDKNGNVYVCVFEANKVIKFLPNLEEQDLSFTWKVSKPVSIGYCETKNKLYVGTSGSVCIYSKDLD